MELIEKLLKATDLQQYLAVLQENDIDDSIILELDNDDLKELGFSLGHRKQLLKAIENYPGASEKGEEPEESTATVTVPTTDSAPQGTAEAERLHLTIVFCDLVGSTAISNRHDPEDVRIIVSTYHDLIAKTVAPFGGYIAELLGDGAVIYFGYPNKHENDPERAIRFALALQEALSNLGPVLNETIQARIGIATGFVVIGNLIGEGVSSSRAVSGSTPNLAARLEGIAGVSEVVIDERTRKLIGTFFEMENLGTHQLKGFEEPIQVWKVLSVKKGGSRFQAMRGNEDHKLIGREDELQLLISSWAKIYEGIGKSFLIFGEAGIGKSHFVEAVLIEINQDSENVIRLFCSPLHVDTALYTVLQFLEYDIEFDEEGSAIDRLDTIEEYLAKFSITNEHSISLIASALSIDYQHRYELLDYTPGVFKNYFLATMVEYFQKRAEMSPLLVIIEDLHWIDASSDNFLNMLSESVRRMPTLMIATARPSYTPSWSTYPAAVTTLSLQSLSNSAVEEIILQTTGGKKLPFELVEEIKKKTDGVPIFVEELTKNILELGIVEEGKNEYTLIKPIEDFGIPDTLHDSLISRLDQRPFVKEVAQIGAVIGRMFSKNLHATISEVDPKELDEALDILVESAVIRKGLDQITFRHALLQDAIYASLLKSQRKVYHQKIANALERKFPKIAEGEPEVLAYHYTQAEQTEKAHEYLLKAGNMAFQQAAVPEALNHFNHALDLVKKQPESEDMMKLEVITLISLGQASLVAYGFASNSLLEEVIERAAELCEKLGASTELFAVFLFSSWIRLVRGDYYEAERFADLALAHAPSIETHMAVNGTLKGGANFFRGELKIALKHFDEVLAIYDTSKHLELAKDLDGTDPSQGPLAWGSIIHWLEGQTIDARKRQSASIERANEVKHKPNTATAYGWASFFSMVTSNQDLALEFGLMTKDLGKELGFPFREAEGMIANGWATAMRGDVVDGRDELVEGIALWRVTGGEVARPLWLVRLAEVYMLEDDLKKAEETIDEAIELALANNEQIWWAELWRWQAKLFSELKKFDEAISLCAKAIEKAKEDDYLMIELKCRTDLFLINKMAGEDVSDSLKELSKCIDEFPEDPLSTELAEAVSIMKSA
jgi:class 3 adenylate cyclase/tetratricopeptide (TPR) repeat protein